MATLPSTKRLLAYFVFGAGLAVCALATYTWAQRGEQAPQQQQARRTASSPAPGAPLTGEDLTATVYKSPSCGCCKKWVAHLRENGFTVETRDRVDMAEIKDRLDVPKKLRSCHTAVIGGEVVEGHVPAGLIKQYLRRDSAMAAGLAVPGMPVGSPGMEIEGRAAQPYQVIAFRKNGRAGVYAQQ